MPRTQISTTFAPLLLSFFLLVQLAAARACAQAPASASVAVRMIDSIDSSKDPAGKQYRASVTKAVDTGNGVMIPQGAPAAVALVNSGSGWTTQLVAVTVNGQPVAVSSSAASVTAPAQSAAAGALSSVNSVLGGFGRHVNAPAATTAIATGQRVVLPLGTALNFVMTQPAATATAAAPAPAAAAASAAPAMSAVSAPVATAGQHWWVCRYQDKKNPANAALGSVMYYAVLPADPAFPDDHFKKFNLYVQQNYKIMDPDTLDPGFCRRVSDDAAARANSMDMFVKQWKSSNIDPIPVNFTNGSGSGRVASPTSPAPVVNSKECAFHATCGAAAPAPAAPSGVPTL